MTESESLLTRQFTAARRLWRHVDLVKGLATRNLKVKYQRSVLGFLWTLLNPLLTVSVLVAVFTHVVRIQLEAFWAFLLSGYFVWIFIQQTLHSGTYVLAEHGPLSRAVAFPKEAPILAAALSRLVEFGLSQTLVLTAIVLFYHGDFPVSYLIVPWLVVLQVTIALGLALPIATLSVFYHDVAHAMPVLLTTLFYLSPVFYSADLVPESFRSIYMVNPIAQLLTLYHTAVYAGQMPALSAVVTTTLVAGLLLIIGYAIFNAYERLFAEIV